MKEHFATLTSKGQVTIPAEVRRHLGLQQGDAVAFVIDPTGGVRLEVPRYPTLESLAGAAGSLPTAKPFDEVLAEAREERLANKYGRPDQ